MLGRCVVVAESGVSWAFFIVEILEAPQAIELLAQAACRRVGCSCNSVRCNRSSRPFCCGLPGAMRSGTTPALITLTDSCDSPPPPARQTVALRSAVPRQAELRKTHPIPTTLILLVPQCLAAKRSRYRLWASLSVSGSQCVCASQEPALEVDAPHTSLAAAQCANGALDGGLRRRRQHFTVGPRGRTASGSWPARTSAVRAAQAMPALHGSPGRMRPPRRQAMLGDLCVSACG